jgi:hypothetical protein
MKQFIAVGIIIALVAGLSFLLSWPVYALWNGCLVDAVTIAKPITWLQAWGLTALFAILVKSGDVKASVK